MIASWNAEGLKASSALPAPVQWSGTVRPTAE